MKPTPEYLKKQIRDEKRSAKDYRKRGFPEIAEDESKHKRILTKKLKQLQRRKK
jgi:hypothetical protein